VRARAPWLAWLGTWALGSVALACGSPELPADLGDDPLDAVRLIDAPALLHLAAALDDPDDLTAEDLIRQPPRYVRPPDPTPLYDQVEAAHAQIPADPGAVPLRVLSFNAGLLDRWYPFVVLQVPEVDVRRERVPPMLLDDGWDVLLLQEVWDQRDVEVFEREAARAGYLVHAGSPRAHEGHGLLMLVREALVDPAGPDERGEELFELQRDIEDFPGPAFVRGFLSWRFRHAPTGVVLDLFDIHTTAFADYFTTRDTQVRQLGRAVRRVADDEVVVVGGDFNGAPYAHFDVYGEEAGQPVVDWWRNTQAYALLLHYGGLTDAHVAAGEAVDVPLSGTVPEVEPSFFDEPYGDRTRCDGLRGGFTVSDCNSLAFRQFAASGPPGRIDFVLLRDASGRVWVDDSAVQYEDPLPAEDFEASDHYGVGATLRLPGDL